MKSQKKYYFQVVYYDSLTDYTIGDVLLRMYINLFITYRVLGFVSKFKKWNKW